MGGFFDARRLEHIFVVIEQRGAAGKWNPILCALAHAFVPQALDKVLRVNTLLCRHQVVQVHQGLGPHKLEPPYIREQSHIRGLLGRQRRRQLVGGLLIVALHLNVYFHILLRFIELGRQLLLALLQIATAKPPMHDGYGAAGLFDHRRRGGCACGCDWGGGWRGTSGQRTGTQATCQFQHVSSANFLFHLSLQTKKNLERSEAKVTSQPINSTQSIQAQHKVS